MERLKYKVITSEKQYDKYCNILHDLDFSTGKKTKAVEEEIDLLVLLIEKWDKEHRTFRRLNPIELLKSLMDEHKMKPKDLVDLLEISKGYVSGILNYKKGLSKEVIRKLSDRFKISQEAFNRPYPIISESNRKHQYEAMIVKRENHDRNTLAMKKKKSKRVLSFQEAKGNYSKLKRRK